MNKQYVLEIEIEQLRGRLSHVAKEAEEQQLRVAEEKAEEAIAAEEKVRKMSAELKKEQRRSDELGAENARLRSSATDQKKRLQNGNTPCSTPRGGGHTSRFAPSALVHAASSVLHHAPSPSMHAPALFMPSHSAPSHTVVEAAAAQHLHAQNHWHLIRTNVKSPSTPSIHSTHSPNIHSPITSPTNVLATLAHAVSAGLEHVLGHEDVASKDAGGSQPEEDGVPSIQPEEDSAKSPASSPMSRNAYLTRGASLHAPHTSRFAPSALVHAASSVLHHAPSPSMHAPSPFMPSHSAPSHTLVEAAAAQGQGPSALADAPSILSEEDGMNGAGDFEEDKKEMPDIEERQAHEHEQEQEQAQALEAFAGHQLQPQPTPGEGHMVLSDTAQTGLGLPLNRKPQPPPLQTQWGQGQGQEKRGRALPGGLFIPSLFGQPGTNVCAVRELAASSVRDLDRDRAARSSKQPPHTHRPGRHSGHRARAGDAGGTGGTGGKEPGVRRSKSGKQGQPGQQEKRTHNAMFVLSAAPNLSFEAIMRSEALSACPPLSLASTLDASVDSYTEGMPWYGTGHSLTRTGHGLGLGTSAVPPAPVPVLSLQDQIYRYAELSALFMPAEEGEEGEEPDLSARTQSEQEEREEREEMGAKLSLDIQRHKQRLVQGRSPRSKPSGGPPSSPSLRSRLYKIRHPSYAADSEYFTCTRTRTLLEDGTVLHAEESPAKTVHMHALGDEDGGTEGSPGEPGRHQQSSPDPQEAGQGKHMQSPTSPTALRSPLLRKKPSRSGTSAQKEEEEEGPEVSVEDFLSNADKYVQYVPDYS
jgi:hypothetical protein